MGFWFFGVRRHERRSRVPEGQRNFRYSTKLPPFNQEAPLINSPRVFGKGRWGLNSAPRELLALRSSRLTSAHRELCFFAQAGTLCFVASLLLCRRGVLPISASLLLRACKVPAPTAPRLYNFGCATGPRLRSHSGRRVGRPRREWVPLTMISMSRTLVQPRETRNIEQTPQIQGIGFRALRENTVKIRASKPRGAARRLCW